MIKELKLNFLGLCTTKTTRPFYVTGNDADACKSRRDYDEQIQFFNFGQDLVSESTLAARKHSWNFDFKFPDQTEPQFSRWAHGSKYLKDPHPLPPSFQICTSIQGGEATISYSLQAKLVFSGSKATKRVTEMLGYLPSFRDTPLEPLLSSRVLYGQIWKPRKETKSKKDKLLRRQSEVPKIVPTIHVPEKIAPAQHIPLLLSLYNANGGENPECILDSLTVNITTYTTLICGQPLTQPEDVVSKTVTCISKQQMNKPLSFSNSTPLTSNFRLVDDAECVPTFRTYSITRRYTMTVVLGVKCADQRFTIRSTTPLDILPSIPLSELRSRLNQEDENEIDPLPLYQPREPSKEFAPDYEELYSSSPSSSTSLSLALTATRSSSFTSGASTPSTAPTTPEREIEQPSFERTGVRLYPG